MLLPVSTAESCITSHSPPPRTQKPGYLVHSSSLNVHCVVLPRCQESPWTCIFSPLSVVLPQSGIIIEGECIHRLLRTSADHSGYWLSAIHPPPPILRRSYILPPPPRTKSDKGNFSPLCPHGWIFLNHIFICFRNIYIYLFILNS